MRKVAVFLLVAAIVACGLTAAQSVSAQAQSGAPIVVDEVQAGTTNYRDEFILLYNRTDAAINVDDYKVATWDADQHITAEVTLAGQLQAYGMLYLVSSAYLEKLEAEGNAPMGALPFSPEGTQALAATGGHVVLQDASGSIIDKLGYGNASNPEGTAAPELPSNQALKRCTNAQGLAVDTEDNSADFVLIDTPLSSQPGPLCENLKEPPEEPEAQCIGVVLSEILPNAAGADGGNEFIEIYNPTKKAVPLHGCYLRLGSKEYHFTAGTKLAAGEYKAFYDSETGITLPNSAGGEVMLVTHDTEEIVQYPGGMPDDVSLALIDGKWQQTHKLTPNVANELKEEAPVGGRGGGLKPCGEGKYRHPETNRCRKTESGSGLKPCEDGQERNPATNRCRSVSSGSSRSLVPCKPGQERNPATNRCRSIATAASSLKPCKPDQFRNPETNRCKKKDSGDGLKPCKEGWERNPETNRCRKKRDAAEAAFAVEETPPSAGSQVGWWAAGVAGAGVLGYGIWQWRPEITAGLQRLLGKGSSAGPGA